MILPRQQPQNDQQTCGTLERATSRSIKIVPAKMNSSQLQQENYEALMDDLDNKMYRRITSSSHKPLSTANRHNLVKTTNNKFAESDVDYYWREEGIFDLDL